MMINDEDDQRAEEVTSATMRRLAFEKIDEDYYLGAGGGVDEALDSDDDMSEDDDELKTHLRQLAGVEVDKNECKDAFGRRRRRSEFEDEMDDELDRSITEYANEHMGATKSKIAIDDKAFEEECKKADEEWKTENEDVERRMMALEMLPYDVDLTDSEVDPEMPAVVLKDKSGEAMKLVYSCKNGEKFDVENRRRRQKERRLRVAASRQPENIRRQQLVKTVADAYTSNTNTVSDKPPSKKFVKPSEATTSKPLSSILKKTTPKKEEAKEEKMEVDEDEKEEDEEEETNPIKQKLKDRLKEIEKNDELFYDDMEDEDNEKWVDEKRKETRGDNAPNSDADGVLSCPGCMIELTRDCQRHEIYKTQYRAMFVSNCVLDSQKLAVEKTGKGKRRDKQKAKRQMECGMNVDESNEGDLFTPVKCSSCSTLVAMMDSDEVYHFFNVLSGYS